jgi:predicted dehydrogenase
MYWLLDAEPVSVSAYSLPQGKRDPIGENNLVAIFQFADGSVGSLTYCTVGSKTSGGERVEAFAQSIGLESQDFKRMTVKASIRTSRKLWFAEKGYDAQMRAFLDSIRSGKPGEVTVRDGARATLGCLRMMESARAGEPCRIDLDAMLDG